MNFAQAVERETKFTKTENGAVALNTTGNACLDLYSTIGSLRDAELSRVLSLFDEAYKENPLLATKIVFYARDVRGGLGERKVFRDLIHHMACVYPESIKNNIYWIPEYGRYDDWYALVDTPLEQDMWTHMKSQMVEDFKDYNNGKPISLLAKWLKTADASSKKTRELGIKTALGFGISVRNYKRIVRNLRKYLKITETYMSANKWNEIFYPSVPSRCMLNNQYAFYRHDAERFQQYKEDVSNGRQKINSSTLYPYDLINEIDSPYESDHAIAEAQWKNLPNYVEPGRNVLVMADVSGSMNGRPMQTSVGLAIYFAERNIGPYHNLFMTFSGDPEFVSLKGNTLYEKYSNAISAELGFNTDLKKAFDKILKVAIDNHIDQEEMPEALVVISDMEIDQCTNDSWTFYDQMADEFKKHGYEIPNIVFWNVQSRNNVFHADSNRKGVQLCSGQSASTFQNVISAIGLTPIEAMEMVINSERYDNISITSK